MKKKRRLKKSVLYVLLIFFICLFVASIVGVVSWINDHNGYMDIKSELDTYVTVTTETTEEGEEKEVLLVDFEKLKELNNDTVAFLYVNGTNINYPIVQTDNNDFYLNHTFNKNKNDAGWVFMDYRNKLDGKDKNIIMYGHNRIDGIMFGSLKKTLEADWYNNPDNLKVQLITEEGINYYQVFSVYKIRAEDYYIRTEFDNNFKVFLDNIASRSVHNFDVPLEEDDQIITLSTCVGFTDTRLVLHAKLIKDTE